MNFDVKLNTNMKTAITLLEILLAAIVLAVVITIIYGTTEVRIIATVFAAPQIILYLIFIYYCKMGKFWSYAGALILSLIGIILRVSVSTQPNLEVGAGGLPVDVQVIYLVLGALVALKTYEAMTDIKETNKQSTS